ncbi:MAG TPA: acyltransferase family protein [Ktedonobacterales bacterium]|nr:acyltransferase family protein [Ktedonobacterales bacterium]
MPRLLADEPRAPHAPVPAQQPQHRSHELDWLRAFIILALVPGHAIGFFTANTAKYLGTQYASPIGLSTLMIVGTWGMALLFLVAGAAAYHMLVRRSPRRFIGDRSVRLLIPFLFACLTLIPLQDYLIVHAFPDVLDRIPAPPGLDPHLTASPLTFYRWFVAGYVSFLMHYTPQYEFIFWSHLWFIPRLLAISLLTLPLLLWLRGARGTRLIAWLATLCERQRGAVFLLALPLALILAVFGWQWQGWQVVGAPDGANVLSQFLYYTLVYVYGFVLYSDVRLRQAVRRDGGMISLVVAIVAFIITQIPGFGVGNQALAHDLSAGGIMAAMLRATAAWLCIVSILGLSMRFLAFTNRFGQYLTEASYPFYVLHLAVLYLIGLPLLASGAPVVVDFLAMVILTYGITLAVYELFVRRVRPVRALFGMSKKSAMGRKSTPASA